VETFIDAVKAAGIARCVASSARTDKMLMTLDQTGLLPHFSDVLFSATMVSHGKPAPDLFLHASSCMGFSPADCIVVEDSVAGTQASPPACACFPTMATPFPTATGWRKPAASCSTTCASWPASSRSRPQADTPLSAG
jgi:hypothetical protein